jgi:glycosyltransferase involved in cell wall biosynthesis
VISTIAEQHPSVHLLRHEKNKRQGGGSNTAIRYAHGDYAVFMDQDDEILPYDLLGQIEYMQKHELELLLGRVVCVDGMGKRTYWAQKNKESDIMSGPQFFRDELINKVGFGAVWMGIYKVDLLKRTEPFVENLIYEDTDWCWKCCYNAKRVQFKPFDMYLYHNNPASSSHNVTAQKLEWKVRLSMRVFEWAKQVKAEKEIVQYAAEDFYTWNLQGLNVLLRFPYKERKKFYQTFSSEEYKIFQSWPTRYKQMYMLKYPRLSQVFLIFASPIYRLLRCVKRALKT